MYDVEFSHDGRYLVYGSGGVHVMDFATREDVMVLEHVRHFAVHPYHNWLAIPDYDWGEQPPYTSLPFVKVLEIPSGDELKTFRITTGQGVEGYAITELAFSADGETLGFSVSGIPDGTCGTAATVTVVFDVGADENQRETIIYSSNQIAISPDGMYTAGVLEYFGGPNTGAIQTWNLHTGEAQSLLMDSDETRWITPLDFQFSPDSQTLTALAYGGLLLHWRVDSGELLNEIEMSAFDEEGDTATSYSKGSLTYSPDGENIVVVTPTALQIWNADLTEHLVIPLSNSFANAQVHPSGNYVTLNDNAQQTQVWKVNGTEVTTHILQTSDENLNHQISETGEIVAYVQEDTLQIWNTNNNDERVIEEGFSTDDHLSLSKDGSTLAQWTPTGEIHLWNTQTHERISTLLGEFPYLGDIIISPDAATASVTQIDSAGNSPQEGDQSSSASRIVVTLWSIATGEHLYDLGEFTDIVEIAYNQDGTRLGIRNQFLESGFRLRHLARIVNTRTGQVEFSHESSGDGSYFSPNLDFFVADISDWSELNLEIYDTHSGERLMLGIHDHMYDGSVWGFSPDSANIVVGRSSFERCGGDYRALTIYELPSVTAIQDLGLISAALDYRSETFDFSTNNAMVMLATTSGISLNALHGETRSVGFEVAGGRQAYFNPDDTLIVTTGSDGTIRLYGVLSEGG